MIRIIVLAAVALAMAAVMILTWGSVGSVFMGFGLITLGSSLLCQKFVTNQDSSDFQMEE